MTTRTKGYAKITQPLAQRAVRWPAAALLSHWLFQSLTYMDATERWFKLALDAALTAMLSLLLLRWLPLWPTLLLAWVAAHTVNMLANGHLWGVLKHYGYTHWSYAEFQRYTQQLAQAAASEPSISAIIAYGSLARTEWSPSSDLDVRIVRRAGMLNGLRACWFLLRQRSRATLAGFPLDAYVVDSRKALQRLAADEHPILIYAAPKNASAAPDTNSLTGARRWLTTFGELLLFVACVLPSMALSTQALQEPWNTFRLARAQMSLASNHVLPYVTAASGYRSEHIGGEIIASALIRSSGWPLEALALLPLGALLLALAYYGLSYALTSSRLWAAAITLFASWYYPGLYSQFGTQTYAWVYVQFLGFLLLLWLWLQQRTLLLSGALVVLFIATFFSYHTTPLWMIMALFCAVAGRHIHERSQGIKPVQWDWALPLFCTLFFFSFDTVVVGDGLRRAASGESHESLFQSLVSKVLAPFLNRTPSALDPFEIAPVNQRLATWSTLAVLLLLTLPVLLWCGLMLRRGLKARSLSALVPDARSIFVWTIVLVAVGHGLIYMAYGALSFRVIPLAFPLLLPLLWTSTNAKHAAQLIAALTVVCAIVGFTSFAPTVQPAVSASQTGLAAKLLPANRKILADANLYGSLQLQAAYDQRVLDFTWINAQNYGAVVTDQPADSFDYVAMSTGSEPLTSSGWQYFAPWPAASSQSTSTHSYDQIYASAALVVLQPSGQPLASYQPTSADLAARGRTGFAASITLWLTLMLLIGVPGLALAWLAQRGALVGRSADIRTMAGLAVALGIANLTLLGYVANFSPLGLRSVVPLVIGAPLLALLGLLLIKRQPVAIASVWLHYGATLLLVSLLWAAMATAVSAQRSAASPAQSELFITQTQPDALTLTVTNPTAQRADFELTIAVDGQVRSQQPLHLAPGALSSQQWQVDPALLGQPATITLLQQGQPLRTLHLAALRPGM